LTWTLQYVVQFRHSRFYTTLECHSAWYEAGQEATTVFKVFGMTRPGIEINLEDLLGREQHNVP